MTNIAEVELENDELRRRLAEAEDALRAIREGEVDTIVVDGTQGAQVFSLTGAETVYRLAVETMQEAALNVSPDGSILFCNARFGEFVATPLEQLPGRNLADFVAPDDRQRLQALLEACEHKPVKQRLTLLAANGSVRPMHVRGHPLTQADGVGVCLVAADLTELESSAQQIDLLREHRRANEQAQAELRESRRAALNLMEDALEARDQADQANAALRESEERYRTLFESMAEGFAVHEIITDEQGRPCDYRFLDVNPAFERLTGLKRTALLGKRVKEVLPGTESSWIESYGRVALTGEAVRFENFSASLDRWYEVFAYQPAPRRFAVVFTDVTVRKRAEEALRLNEERLRLALKAGRRGMWDWHVPSGKIVWNDEHYRIFGYEPGAVAPTYDDWRTRVHPEDVAATEAGMQRCMEQDTDYEAEYRVLWPDGTVRWVEAQGSFGRDDAGQVVRSYGVLADTTRRKQAEAALRASEELFRVIFTESSVGMAQADPATGRFVRVNSAFCQIAGCSEEELLQRTFRELTHPEDREADSAKFAAIIRGDIKSYKSEKRYLRPDGAVVWVETVVNLIYDAARLPLRSIATIQDITERKLIEEALRASEARFRTLFETMAEGFSVNEIILDEAGKPVDLRYSSVNPAFERHTGLKAADIVGRTTRELFPEAEPVWFERYGKVVLTGEPAHFEERFGPLDKWFEVSAYRTEPQRFAVVFFDITERRRAENQLRHNLMALEAANHELDAFTYSVSHDLRAPLRGVHGFAKILQDQLAAAHLNEDALHCLQMISDNALRMGRLIDDLLAFSRLSQQAFEKEPVKMKVLVETALKELEAEQKDRRIEITVEKLPEGDADERLLKQVWLNLLSNALKFTRGREPAVIHVGCETRDGLPVYFVRDNGTGFDMRYAHKLFGIFQRLHRDEDFEGTGVGLAISERIISRHGGRMWAEATKDGGATFYFTLRQPRDA